MKHKITWRLIGYFSAVLFIFSVIVGSMFFLFSARHTTALNEMEMKKHAVSIADAFSLYLSEGEGVNIGEYDEDLPGQHGHRKACRSLSEEGSVSYLRLIDKVAMGDVWLVDEQAQTIQIGHEGHGKTVLSYKNLPVGAEQVIQKVYKGNVEVSTDFSSLLSSPSLTAGAPVYGSSSEIIGVLLLHRPMEGMQQAQYDGLQILGVCILMALVLAAILAVLLVRRFIRPLYEMAGVAQKLTAGEYSVCTGISQKDEIGILARNIDALAGRLAETEQERGRLEQMRQEFISNISHELRTPVTVMKGSLEVLDEGLVTEPEEIKEYVHQMLADANYLQRLVNDLLELSRLESNDFKIEKTELNFTDVLTESVRSIRRIANHRQIEIRLNISYAFVPFTGDYGRLRQMFTIFLDNAVKFSPAGGMVAVEMKAGEKYVVLIHNDGSYIPKEEISGIFERFQRKRSECNKEGTGLGLPIAREIAKRHGGAIYCESTREKGTDFILEFIK